MPSTLRAANTLSQKEIAEVVEKKIQERLEDLNGRVDTRTLLRDKKAQVWETYVRIEAEAQDPSLQPDEIRRLLPNRIAKYELAGKGTDDDGQTWYMIQFRAVGYSA